MYQPTETRAHCSSGDNRGLPQLSFSTDDFPGNSMLSIDYRPPPGFAQLSQNSGINGSDTWITFDLTISSSGTAALPNAVYNPSTGTSSSSLSVTPVDQTFHVEAGYDSTGSLIMNLWPTGTPIDGDTTDADAIGFIRYAGGQITIFDQTGNPISPGFPAGVPTNWPLTFLGSNPSSSVIQHLVVLDIGSYSNGIHAAYSTYSQSDTMYATVTPPMSSGDAQWTYVSSGSNWVAQQLSRNVPTQAGSFT